MSEDTLQDIEFALYAISAEINSLLKKLQEIRTKDREKEKKLDYICNPPYMNWENTNDEYRLDN